MCLLAVVFVIAVMQSNIIRIRLGDLRYVVIFLQLFKVYLVCTQVEILWRLTEKLLLAMISLSIAHPMIIQVPVCFCTFLCIFLLCDLILCFHTYAMHGKLQKCRCSLNINLRISADPPVFLQGLALSDGTDYDIPRTNTMSGEQAFSVSGPSHWNSLPASVRAAIDPRSFKKNLKTYYFILCFNYFYFIYSLRDICNVWLVRLVVSRAQNTFNVT